VLGGTHVSDNAVQASFVAGSQRRGTPADRVLPYEATAKRLPALVKDLKQRVPA